MTHPLLASIRAFLFDFDGTLAELQIDFSALRREILSLADGLGLNHPAMPDPPYLLELTRALRDQISARDPRKAELLFSRSMALIEEKEQEAASPANLFPYTKKALDFLIRADYRVAILTRNSGLSVRRVFPDLDRYCHLFLPRETVDRPKPDPGHVQTAIRGLEVEPHQALMVGDHPLDILSGREGGLKTVGVLTGKTRAPDLEAARPDLILPDVEALFNLMVTSGKN